MKLFPLKISSAVALNGVIHKAGSIVSVAEPVAKDLLRRGRAVVHAVAEVAEHVAAEDVEDQKPTATEPEPAAKPSRKK